MTDAPIVTFGIPLMGRAVARDWERVVHHFNATLASLYNQTDPNFRIIVACTDRPELRVPTDERLEFIEVPQLKGDSYGTTNSDAGVKRHMVGTRLHALGGGYLMYVDADDLVSARLVGHARLNDHPGGYAIRRGYFLDAETARLSLFPLRTMKERTFDQICGTCCMVRFAADELPGGTRASVFDDLISCGHNHTAAAAERVKRPLADVPFRAAVYVKNTGDNVSNIEADDNPYLSFATSIAGRAAREAIPITREIDREFGVVAACHFVSGLRPLERRAALSVTVCTYRRPGGLDRLLDALERRYKVTRDVNSSSTTTAAMTTPMRP